MGPKALLLVLFKAIGLFLIVHGIGGVVASATRMIYYGILGGVTWPPTAILRDHCFNIIWMVGSLVQIAFGVYLFLGGRWLASLALPGRRPCDECGYDLYRGAGDRCPECGTARRRMAG